MYYLLLLCGAFTNMLQNIFTKTYDQRVKKSNNFVFTLFVSLSVMVFYLALNGFSFEFDLFTLWCGIAFGISYVICMVLLVVSLTTGPMSFASLFVNFALIIPSAVGIIAYKEYPTGLFYVGLVLLLVSLAILKLGKSEDGGTKMTPKWMVTVFITFLTNGICAALQPFHQKMTGGKYKSEFMTFAMIFVAIVCIVAIIIQKIKKPDSFSITECAKKGGIFGALAGVTNGFTNLMVMVSTGHVPQSVIFPILCGGGVMLVIVASALIYKEKLSKLQWVSVGICFVSFLLIGIGQ